jgi:hypothetical protein
MTETGIPLSRKISTWLNMLLHWNLYTDGKHKGNNQILVTKKMAKKLLTILRKEGYQSSVYDEEPKIAFDEFVIYDSDGIYITIQTWDNDMMGIALYPTYEIDKWKYASGQSFGELDKTQISHMMFTLENFIGDKYGHYAVN